VLPGDPTSIFPPFLSRTSIHIVLRPLELQPIFLASIAAIISLRFVGLNFHEIPSKWPVFLLLVPIPLLPSSSVLVSNLIHVSRHRDSILSASSMPPLCGFTTLQLQFSRWLLDIHPSVLLIAISSTNVHKDFSRQYCFCIDTLIFNLNSLFWALILASGQRSCHVFASHQIV
jgi:hypothetical protein